MGWTSWDHESRDTDTVLRDEFKGMDIVASATVGTTWYAAARIKQHPGVTLAVVVLTSRRRGGFCYKDMDETMGPVESRCPARILALLSPISEIPYGPDSREWAQQWRDRCRDWHAAAAKLRTLRPAPGDRVILAEPLKYGGAMIADFVIVENPKTWRGRRRPGVIARRTNGGGGLYRLPLRMLGDAEIIKGGGVAKREAA